MRCGNKFSLVPGGKEANKRFERNRTHSPRQLKVCFPRPKLEQRALQTPSTAAIIRRWLRADAEMAFMEVANMGACWEREKAWVLVLRE